MKTLVEQSFDEHIFLVEKIRTELARPITSCAVLLLDCLKSGGKILVCGNGGSAADAQHFVAELVGPFEADRRGLPAVALTSNSSSLTSISNDFGFDQCFARQVAALAQANDVLVAISASGDSPNVLAAVEKARICGCRTVSLSGRDGGRMAQAAEYSLVVPAQRAARIQEMHVLIIHMLCELIEVGLEEV